MLPIIVLDFDGTLTETDVGRALCERYADPSWQEPIQRWIGGQISFPEAQQQVWSTITVNRDQLLAYALTIGQLRAGAGLLFDAAQKGLVELVLASGGFDLYIEPLLGKRLRLLRHAFYNHLQFTEQGVRTVFPYQELACKGCGVCKAKVIERFAAVGQRILFCGDGSSDRCAASSGSELFAVRGGDFDKYCSVNRVSYTPFDDFRTVLAEALR